MAQDASNGVASTSDLTRNNVEAIAQLEHVALQQRTLGECLSGAITRVIGSGTSVIAHLLVLLAWVVINLQLIPSLAPFDPFPFSTLALLLTGEGVFLAIFILVSQNCMTRQAERRAHLDLQINMLAEQELTMILKLQQRLCSHLGLDVEQAHAEIQQLAQPTDVQQLVDALDNTLPQ